MPRGMPDYQVLQTQTVRQSDVGENYSAYDVGFTRIDGGGRVVFFDDFRNGLYRWAKDFGSNDSEPFPVIASNYSYGFHPSIKLYPFEEGNYSAITLHRSFASSGKMGIEFAVLLYPNFGTLTVTYQVAVDSDIMSSFSMKIEDNGAKVSIQSVGVWYEVFAPPVPLLFEGRYVTMKMIVNPALDSYDSLLIGGAFVDISQYPRSFQSAFNDGYMAVNFSADGVSAIDKEPVYLGYVVISADEP